MPEYDEYESTAAYMDAAKMKMPRDNMNRFADDETVQAEPISTRILSQLTFMEDQIAKLHDMLKNLEQIIEPILLPEDTENVPSPYKVPQSTSIISASIDSLNHNLSKSIRRIQHMAERVQL